MVMGAADSVCISLRYLATIVPHVHRYHMCIRVIYKRYLLRYNLKIPAKTSEVPRYAQKRRNPTHT